MSRYFLVALFLVVPCLAWGGRTRDKPLMLTVHIETDAAEGPQFSFPLPVPGTGETRFFKKSADITDREVEWFYLFPAENGNGHGAAFKLGSVGTTRLEYISSSNQGRYLLAAVHPGCSSFVRIDKVISDGIIVVWDGLNDTHIALLREHLEERAAAVQPGDSTAATPPDASAPASAPASEKKKRLSLFRK